MGNFVVVRSNRIHHFFAFPKAFDEIGTDQL